MNNQAKHIKVKNTFKIVGAIMLVVGIIFDIIGFVSFFSSLGSFSTSPTKFWCIFIGLPLTFIGLAFLSIGFRKEVMSYFTNETVPVINEAASGVKPAIKDMASVFSDEFNKDNTPKIRCDCGEINNINSNFCNKCGTPLKQQCPKCGEKIVKNSTYCNHCGKRL